MEINITLLLGLQIPRGADENTKLLEILTRTFVLHATKAET